MNLFFRKMIINECDAIHNNCSVINENIALCSNMCDLFVRLLFTPLRYALPQLQKFHVSIPSLLVTVNVTLSASRTRIFHLSKCLC